MSWEIDHTVIHQLMRVLLPMLEWTHPNLMNIAIQKTLTICNS